MGAQQSTPKLSVVERDGLLSRRAVGLALGLLALCLLVLQLRDVFSYSRWWTDEDQTLLWEAGRDLLHFQLHSPNFWGQSYNTVFEGLPGALIHLTGLTLATAQPLGAALMATACWGLLVYAALKRKYLISAALALALPVCLSIFYLLLFDQLRGVLTGDLLAAASVACAVRIQRPRLRLGLTLLLGGVAIVWDNASILAVFPAVAAIVAEDWRALARSWPQAIAVSLAGVAPATALRLFEHAWYAARPLSVIYGAPLNINASALWRDLTHPEQLFSFFAPETLRSSWVAVGLVVILCAACCYAAITRRCPAAAAAALAFVAVILLIMASADVANYQPDLYLSDSRFLLPLPLGAWFVAHQLITALQVKPVRRLSWRPPRARIALPLITLVAVLSTGVAQASFSSQLNPVIALQKAGGGVDFENAPALLRKCAHLTAIYRSVHADILITASISALPMACTADTDINTFSPQFDRRRWLVDGVWQTRPMTRILFLGWKCSQLPPKLGGCTHEASGLLLLTTPPRPVIKTLSLAGIYYR